MKKHETYILTANLCIGSDIFLYKSLDHAIFPAIGGISLGMGGSSFCLLYNWKCKKNLVDLRLKITIRLLSVNTVM